MSNLILHTGGPGTVVRRFQRLFAANRTLLAERGIDYPDLGAGPGHDALAGLWHNPKGKRRDLFGDKGAGGALDELVAAHAPGARTLVLSGEAFTRVGATRVDMAALRERLKGFETVTVIHVLRGQYGLLPALYLERAPKGRLPAFPAVCRNAVARDRAVGAELDGGAVLDHLLDGFAMSEIVLADHDTLAAAPGGLAGLVLDRAGAGIAAADLAAPKGPASPPEPLAWHLAGRAAGASGGAAHDPDRKTVAVATRLLQEMFGKAMRSQLYTRTEAAGICRHFAPHNDRLAARLAREKPDFALTTEVPKLHHVYRDDIDAELEKMLRERLAEAGAAEPSAPGAGSGTPRKRHAGKGGGAAPTGGKSNGEAPAGGKGKGPAGGKGQSKGKAAATGGSAKAATGGGRKRAGGGGRRAPGATGTDSARGA